MGEDMHVKGQRLFGKSLCLPLFCCEPKTILKTKIFTKKKKFVPMVGVSASLRTSVLTLLCRPEMMVGEVLTEWGSVRAERIMSLEEIESIWKCLIA